MHRTGEFQVEFNTRQAPLEPQRIFMFSECE